VKPWFEPSLPRLFAHRGLAIDTAENTMLAFLKALAAGARYLETDVHVSLDGVAVLSHDSDLLRVAGTKSRIRDLTLAELQQIDLGNGQTICTLAEALTAFPDARFNIDIKADDAGIPAARAILACNAVDRVLIGSFNEARRASAVKLLPGVATAASPIRAALALISAKLGFVWLLRRILSGVDAMQVPIRAYGLTIGTARVIRMVHAASTEIHFWTINDPVQMASLLGLGADGLITDRVDVAIDVVGLKFGH
jgi:glycerophosphoryl diester phosphodiesterase